MATVDPIVQCAACGAKLRLRAASLKVLKQVRCGKCQSMIEIPDILRGDGPFPEGPVLAKMPATGEATSPAPDSPPSAPSVTTPKPVSVPTPVPAPTVVERFVAPAAAVPPAPHAEPRLPPAPMPSAPIPPVPPSPVRPAPVTSMSYDQPRPSDSELVTRLDSLELMLRAQQESISLLTAQLRQVVKAQVTAATTAQAILDR